MASFCSGSSGSGALTQLIAQGALDQYLSQNASFTFWKVRYNKHTNFAMESIGQPFNTAVSFGSEAQITLNRNGDLIFYMYVVIDLPGITACDATRESCAGIGPGNQFPYCGQPCAPCADADRNVVEEYVDGTVSNCIEMLFGDGGPSHAAYAASQPLDHEPGTVWNYSSGTTNIIARIIGDIVSGGPGGDPGNRATAMRSFLSERLFKPTGMTTAEPKFDGAGDFVGSSYVYASARDFASFGELYRHRGVTDLGNGAQILPSGWAAHAAVQVATDDESGFGYGRHWWSWPDVPGSYSCHGYEGQFIVVAPGSDVVLVHLGKTDISVAPALRARLGALLQQLS